MNQRNVPSTALAVPDSIGEARSVALIEGIIPKTPREVGDYCQFLVGAEILPESYATMPAPKRIRAVTIAVMKGLELGLPPLRALQSIYVVNGRPTLYGDEIPALLLHSGKLEWYKEGWEGDGDTRFAWFQAKRVGNPEPVKATFSVADATRMKLIGKVGPWQHSRDRMLKIRARTYVARDLFADVLAGLSVYEEQADIMRSQGREVGAFSDMPETENVDPLADAPMLEARAAPDENGPIVWAGEVIDPDDPGPLALPEQISEQAWRHFALALRTLIERASSPGLKLTWWDLNADNIPSEKTRAWVKEALPVEESETEQNAAGAAGEGEMS